MAAPFAAEFRSDISGTVPGARNIEAFAATASVAGSSSGAAGAPDFTTVADVIFYPSEPIVATASETTMAGAASTIIALPDGSVMTLVGVAAISPVLFAA